MGRNKIIHQGLAISMLPQEFSPISSLVPPSLRLTNQSIYTYRPTYHLRGDFKQPKACSEGAWNSIEWQSKILDVSDHVRQEGNTLCGTAVTAHCNAKGFPLALYGHSTLHYAVDTYVQFWTLLCNLRLLVSSCTYLSKQFLR